MRCSGRRKLNGPKHNTDLSASSSDAIAMLKKQTVRIESYREILIKVLDKASIRSCAIRGKEVPRNGASDLDK